MTAAPPRRNSLLVAGLAMFALLFGYAVGHASAQDSEQDAAAMSSDRAGIERDWLPAQDAPGREIQGLSRFPGSVRVDFDRRAGQGVVVTDADYLTDAPLMRVQRYYRREIARHGWRLVNVTFLRAEWSFLVVRGATETVVEIAARGPLVEIDLEEHQPSPLGSSTASWTTG